MTKTVLLLLALYGLGDDLRARKASEQSEMTREPASPQTLRRGGPEKKPAPKKESAPLPRMKHHYSPLPPPDLPARWRRGTVVL
jgi:hypothetical protein